MNSNTVTVRNMPVQYADVIDAVCAELPEAAQHIDNLVEETTQPVIGDAGLVQRIVANIVINARIYAPHSRIEIRAQVMPDSKAIQLRVIDHGGLPAGEIQRRVCAIPTVGRSLGEHQRLGLA